MPLPWALRGLRDGVVTTAWPRRRDAYFDTHTGAVEVVDTTGPAAAALADQRVLDQLCPSGALSETSGRIALDRGRCIVCGRCVAAAPQVFAARAGADTATLTRAQLVVDGVAETDEQLEQIRRRLAARVRRLRRSLHIRHVDAGSDGSDEWEVQALLNPVYDIHRLGVFFTASPRHADILLVTGVGTAAMEAPLARTREGMPDPVVVIAAGADAISGGLVGRGYTGGDGVGELLDVDVWVPGAPASPFALLYAILLAVDRLPAAHPRPDHRAPSATRPTEPRP
jgi:Ni,Fe-hydrogenase III small subunit/ferredoxin